MKHAIKLSPVVLKAWPTESYIRDQSRIRAIRQRSREFQRAGALAEWGLRQLESAAALTLACR